MDDLRLLEPLGYLDMVQLTQNARLVLTDSGGLQEETTALGIPCLTLRENTERPVTITEGTNRLVPNPTDLPALLRAVTRTADLRRPEGWDGHAGERIVAALVSR